jgi:sacsin
MLISIHKIKIQNADDSGATCFKVIYDKRNFFNGEKLIHPKMGIFMGPSLIAYNNKIFLEEDFSSNFSSLAFFILV